MTKAIDDPEVQDALRKLVALAGERHVKTAQGEKIFKEPIGAPILPHPYMAHPGDGGKATADEVKSAGKGAVADSTSKTTQGKQVGGKSAVAGHDLAEIKVGDKSFHVPAGSKVYTTAPGSQDRFVQFPDGSIYYVSSEGHAPAEGVTEQTLSEWTKAGQITAMGEAKGETFGGKAQLGSLKPGDKFQISGQTKTHLTVAKTEPANTNEISSSLNPDEYTKVTHTHSATGHTAAHHYKKDLQVKVPSDHGDQTSGSPDHVPPEAAPGPEPKTAESQTPAADIKVGTQVTSKEMADAAPAGTTVKGPYGIYTKTANGQWNHPTYGDTPSHNVDWDLDKWKVVQVGSGPATPAAPEAPAEPAAKPKPELLKTGEHIANVGQLKSMPVGGQVTSSVSGIIFTKHADGNFHSEKYGSIITPQEMVDAGEHVWEVTAPGSPDVKPGEKVTDLKQLNDFPTGTVVLFDAAGEADHQYKKLEDGTWVSSDTVGGWDEGIHIQPTSFDGAVGKGFISLHTLPGDEEGSTKAQLQAVADAIINDPSADHQKATGEAQLLTLAPGSTFTTSDGTVLTKAEDGFWEGYSSGLSSKAVFNIYGSTGHISKDAQVTPAGPAEDHGIKTTAPNPQVTFGGVAASADDLKTALGVLENSKGMMIKQPLAKAEHALAGVDYHAIVDEYKKTHPDFQPEGKFAAKEAFLNALKDQIEQMSKAEPDDTAVGKDLGDGMHDFGGVKVTPEQLQEAYDILSQANGMMIKQPLAKAGHPLAASDYHGVVEQHKAATSFKSESKFAAKEAFVSALKGKLEDIGHWNSQNPPATQDAQAKIDGSSDLAVRTFTHGGTTYTISIPVNADVHFLAGPDIYAISVNGSGFGAFLAAPPGTKRDSPVVSGAYVADKVLANKANQIQLVSGHSMVEPHGLNPGKYIDPSVPNTHLIINPDGTGYLADKFGPLNPEGQPHDIAWVQQKLDAGSYIYQKDSQDFVSPTPPAPSNDLIASVQKSKPATLAAGTYFNANGVASVKLTEDGTSEWFNATSNSWEHNDAHGTQAALDAIAASFQDSNGSAVYVEPWQNLAAFMGKSNSVENLKQLQLDLDDPNSSLSTMTKADVLNGDLAKDYGVFVDKSKFANMPEGTDWKQHAKLTLAHMFGSPESQHIPTDDPAQVTPSELVESMQHMDDAPIGSKIFWKAAHSDSSHTYTKALAGWWADDEPVPIYLGSDQFEASIKNGLATWIGGKPEPAPKISIMYAADAGTQIGSVAHLDALPVGSKIKNSVSTESTYTKTLAGWMSDQSGHVFKSDQFDSAVNGPGLFIESLGTGNSPTVDKNTATKTWGSITLQPGESLWGNADALPNGDHSGGSVGLVHVDGTVTPYTHQSGETWQPLDHKASSEHHWTDSGPGYNNHKITENPAVHIDAPSGGSPEQLQTYHGIGLVPGDKVWKQKQGAYTEDIVIQHADGSVTYYDGGNPDDVNTSHTVPKAIKENPDNWTNTHEYGDPPVNASGLTEYMGIKLAPGDSVYHNPDKGWHVIEEENGALGVFYANKDGSGLKLWKTFEGTPFLGFKNGKDQFLIGKHGGGVAASAQTLNAAEVSHAVPTAPTEPALYFAQTPYVDLPSVNKLLSILQYGKKTQINQLAKQLAEDAGFKNVAAQYTSKMSQSQVTAWVKHWINGDLGKAYEIEKSVAPSGEIKNAHKHPGNKPDAHVQWAPAVAGEIPSGQHVDDPSGLVSSAVQQGYGSIPDEVADAYLIAAHMQNPTGLNKTQQKMWAMHHASGNKLMTDKISLMALQHVGNDTQLSEPITPPKPIYGAAQIIPIPHEWKLTDDAKQLTEPQADQYLGNLLAGPPLNTMLKAPLTSKQSFIAAHVVTWSSGNGSPTSKESENYNELKDFVNNHALTSQASDPIATFQQATPLAKKTFTQVEAQHGDPKLDGYGVKYFVTDESGQKYLFKETKEEFRPYVEDAAHQAASLFGYSPAQSVIAHVNGKLGQIQTLIPHTQQLMGGSPSSFSGDAIRPEDLTDTQLADVLREHVFDWVVDNDDSHGGNLLLRNDGHVVGIDKGRAWVHFGKNSLDPDYLSGNTTPYYQHVYQAIMDGSISPERAQKAYQSVMSKAHFVSTSDSARYRQILEYGFERRPSFNTPVSSTKTELIDAAIARQKAASEDFEKLWTTVFNRAGVEKPEFKPQLGPGIHTSVTGEFLAASKAGGFHGHALMVNSPDIEDSHLQVKHISTPSGQQVVGHGQLLDTGDSALMKWIHENADPKIFGGTVVPKKDTLTPDDGSISEQAAYTALVEGVKTISHHSADGQYNQSKIDGAQEAADKLKAQVAIWNKDGYDAAEAWYGGDLAKAGSHVEMAEAYLKVWDQSKAAMEVNGKSPQFDQYLYIPKDTGAKSKAAPTEYKIVKKNATNIAGNLNFETGQFEANGDTFGGVSDGYQYEITLPSGGQVIYRPHADHAVPLAQQGQLRFSTNSGNDEAALSEITDFLRKTGVTLNDANEQSLELHYWRHMYGVLRNRADAKSGPRAKVVQAAQDSGVDNWRSNFGNDPAGELAAWRSAWGALEGQDKVDKWVGDKGYLPKFGHTALLDKDEVHGRPHWQRFDVNEDEFNKKALPLGHGLYNADAIKQIVQSGMLMSTEERTHVLGQAIGGMSSPADAKKGSSNFLFTRQLTSTTNTGFQIYIKPSAMLRTTTYSYDDDKYGEASYKVHSAPWDIDGMLSKAVGNNETMIKYGVSVLDDVAFVSCQSVAQRAEILDYLNQVGIKDIGGIPVDQFFVTEASGEAYTKLKSYKKVS